jgi:hypothetical protein
MMCAPNVMRGIQTIHELFMIDEASRMLIMNVKVEFNYKLRKLGAPMLNTSDRKSDAREAGSRARTFEITTDLATCAKTVLAHAGTMRGVNDELGPFLRMTVPEELAARSIFEAEPGIRLFRSWVLLLGILPIDFDDLVLEEIDPDSGFIEQSTMGTMSRWRHERRVLARGEGGSTIRDHLTFEPTVRASGPVLELIVKALFTHRHRRLLKRFGSVSTSANFSRRCVS